MSARLLVTSCFMGLITLSGCIVNGKNSGLYGDDIKSKLVYDLDEKNIHYAENQLRDRGYRETRREGKHSWWYNEDNNYCYELEESDSKVKKVHSKGDSECWHEHHSNNNHKGLPDSARSACISRFGHEHFDHIKMVSPLKPGYWEVILKGKHGRQVACTVDKHGSIEDWVEM